MFPLTSTCCRSFWLSIPRLSAMNMKASMFLFRAARWKTDSFDRVRELKDDGAFSRNSSKSTTGPLRTARCRGNKPLVLRAFSNPWSSPSNILVSSRSPISHAWYNNVVSEPSTSQANCLARSGNLSSTILVTPDNGSNTKVSQWDHTDYKKMLIKSVHRKLFLSCIWIHFMKIGKWNK